MHGQNHIKDDKKVLVFVKILVGNLPRKTVEIYGSYDEDTNRGLPDTE